MTTSGAESSHPLLVVDQGTNDVALSQQDKRSEKDDHEYHWHKPNFFSRQHELPKPGQKRHRSSSSSKSSIHLNSKTDTSLKLRHQPDGRTWPTSPGMSYFLLGSEPFAGPRSANGRAKEGRDCCTPAPEVYGWGALLHGSADQDCSQVHIFCRPASYDDR